MWSTLFIIAIAQGIFFILLLRLSSKYKNRASSFLSLILLLFLLTNVDYYFVASGLYKSFPWLFGISNGLILLMGPGLLFYAKALVQNYQPRFRDLIHTLPYIIFLLTSMPLYLMSFEEKILFISTFVSGDLPLRTVDYIIFVLQLVHLGTYLLLTRTALQGKPTEHGKWVRSLRLFLFGYGLLVMLLVCLAFIKGSYSLLSNYTFALACSFLLYVVSGFALLNPNVSLEFVRRKQKLYNDSDADQHWSALLGLMEGDKAFVDPDIKLADVAQRIGLTTHKLSQLVNERAGTNFSDFVNQYRVEEFKMRIRQPESSQLTLVGLAFEIGFNSKTSFNNTFKKLTGLTPTEYKKTLGIEN